MRVSLMALESTVEGTHSVPRVLDTPIRIDDYAGVWSKERGIKCYLFKGIIQYYDFSHSGPRVKASSLH